MVEQGCINISLCDILKCFDAVQALAHVAQYVESRTRAMEARLMSDSNSSQLCLTFFSMENTMPFPVSMSRSSEGHNTLYIQKILILIEMIYRFMYVNWGLRTMQSWVHTKIHFMRNNKKANAWFYIPLQMLYNWFKLLWKNLKWIHLGIWYWQ